MKQLKISWQNETFLTGVIVMHLFLNDFLLHACISQLVEQINSNPFSFWIVMKPDLMGTLNWLQSLSQQMVLKLHMQLKMVLKVPEDGRLHSKYCYLSEFPRMLVA